MLQHLYINNYAIIENLELDFENNFSVITGETGAGKSILLGALALILGQRAETSILKDKNKKCIVEGIFKIDIDKFSYFFSKYDLDVESATILRREININGKSRAFINDTPVSLAILKELTTLLIDIHSQHQTLNINAAQYQINVVDAFANLQNEIENFKTQFRVFNTKKQTFNKLKEKTNAAKTDLDYIQFQINEIEALNLQANEQKEIESQLEIINNAAEIKQTLNESVEILLNSDNNIAFLIGKITNALAQISHCSPTYKTLYKRINSLNIELKDIASELDLLNDNAQFNTNNLSFLNNRLDNILTLNQKHKVNNSNELLLVCENLKKELTKITFADEELIKLANEINNFEQELTLAAKNISNKRVAVIKDLSKNIITNLVSLGIPDAKFKIKHKIIDRLTNTGLDEIEFLFSANKGVQEQTLNKIASGGELSRLMLTIKSILANSSNVNTIIFDEIDTGVSGDIADKMGGIMQKMSSKTQVIAITHLPQVAAKGDNHFKIYKKTIKNNTTTFVDKLTHENRIKEIAKMLSGKKITQIAKENAKSLLTNS